MLAFMFLLVSLGTGVVLYAAGFATLLVGFTITSPLIFAYLIYKDIKELQNDRIDLLDIGTGNVIDAHLAAHPQMAEKSMLAQQPKQDMQGPQRDKEIDTIKMAQVPSLLECLPYNSAHHADFAIEDGQWVFRFNLNSPRARFSAGGRGDTPTEAFLVAKQIIQKQIREWHEARAKNLPYQAETNENLLLKIKNAAASTVRQPSVMIVDDDVDVALGLELIFRQLGCATNIITNPNDLHRKMSMGDCDFIVLDWMLSEKLQASHVVEKAIRVIDSFSDLKEKFQQSQPKIITHSVLDKQAVNLPTNSYFKHLDHWQKPVSHYELTTRTSELLAAAGY